MLLAVTILYATYTATSLAHNIQLQGQGDRTQIHTGHIHARDPDAQDQHQGAHVAVTGPPSYAQRHSARNILTKPKNVVEGILSGVVAYDAGTPATHLARRREDYRGSIQEDEGPWSHQDNYARSLKDTLHGDLANAKSAINSANPKVSEAVNKDKDKDKAHKVFGRGENDAGIHKSGAEHAHGSPTHKLIPRDAEFQSTGRGHDFYKPGARNEFYKAQKLKRRDATSGTGKAASKGGSPTQKFMPRDFEFQPKGQGHDFYKPGGRAELYKAQKLRRRNTASAAGAGGRVVVGRGPPPAQAGNEKRDWRRDIETEIPPAEHDERRPHQARSDEV